MQVYNINYIDFIYVIFIISKLFFFSELVAQKLDNKAREKLQQLSKGNDIILNYLACRLLGEFIL